MHRILDKPSTSISLLLFLFQFYYLALLATLEVLGLQKDLKGLLYSLLVFNENLNRPALLIKDHFELVLAVMVSEQARHGQSRDLPHVSPRVSHEYEGEDLYLHAL